MVQQEKALRAFLPIPNQSTQPDEHRVRATFLDTMIAGLLSFADELPEKVLSATEENAFLLKVRLKALARSLDGAIHSLDTQEGTHAGQWKTELVASASGLLMLIPGVTFPTAVLLSGAVFGVQTVKLCVAGRKDHKDQDGSLPSQSQTLRQFQNSTP